MSLHDDFAEVNALLEDLERSRFKSSQRRQSERRKWTGEFAFLLYAGAFWFNSVMTFISGLAALNHPCSTDGAVAYWMYASAWITGGLVLAPFLVAATGVDLRGD